ncbi:TcpE family conjugal transfer membrane protein [Siminovitchia thermophila]|uniref:TcpE family conjugal transfer membrane protein n=1 Tax=Siminovitchia thermophila TaxID=1245522 RepID=UPI0019656811|nr:TcpE family conjugal transfer membrane protein [Siminovitchia thermophila]
MVINRIPLYVLNNFLKFEKKIYQVFGLKLGRPLRMKAVLYGIVFGVGTIVFYNLPYLGNLVNWMPKGVLVLIPIGLAWLLADVGTENRSPIYFFRSFIGYQVRNFITKKTYYRGKEIPRETVYQFKNYFTYTVSDEEVKALEELALESTKQVETDAPKKKVAKSSPWILLKKHKEKFAKQRKEQKETVEEPNFSTEPSLNVTKERVSVPEKNDLLETIPVPTGKAHVKMESEKVEVKVAERVVRRQLDENETSFVTEPVSEGIVDVQEVQEINEETVVRPVSPIEVHAKVDEINAQTEIQEETKVSESDPSIYQKENDLSTQTHFYEEPKQSDTAHTSESINREAEQEESKRLSELEQKVVSLEKLMESNMTEQSKQQEPVGKAILTTLKPLNPLTAKRKEEKNKEQVKKEVFELLSLNPIKVETPSEEKELVEVGSRTERNQMKKKRRLL